LAGSAALVLSLAGPVRLQAQEGGVLAPPGASLPAQRTPAPGYDLGLNDSLRNEKHKTSLLVAPIPFFNEQLGVGLVGVAGGLRRLGPRETTPPSFAGLIGLVTTNGSWGAGFAGKLHLADDAWRLTAAAMYLDIRFTFYGIGQAAAQGVKLREEIVPIRLEGLRRVAPHVYLGLRGQVSKVSIGLNFDSMPPPFAPFVPDPKAFQEVLLAPIFEFDNRDDQMYPTRGWLVNASASFFDSAIGSDSTMQNYSTLITWQHGWGKGAHVIAASAQGCYSTGQVPLDQLCMVGAIDGLRGYETGKYMDRTQVTMQAEYRQRFGRFGFTTFAGAAQIAPTPGDLSTDNLLYAAGVGMRFQLLKRFPLNYRTDVAFGKDGATFYFSVGEAF
jgi:hypothetical protein